MSARLGALRNKNVRARRDRLFRKSNGLDLTDDDRPARLIRSTKAADHRMKA